MRRLRVLTWNTFLAPTMIGRWRRVQHAKQALLHFDQQLRADVVVLQELNSVRAGPFFFTLLWLARTLGAPDELLAWLDLFALLEGLLLPFIPLDHRSELLEFARTHTAFKHFTTSRAPRYFVDAGLVILARFPIEPDQATGSSNVSSRIGGAGRLDTPLPRDIGNRPGVLALDLELPQTEGGDATAAARPAPLLRLYTLHLVPTLPQTSFPYRANNFLNGLFGVSPCQLRQRHAQLLASDVEAARARAKAQGRELHVVMAGDFNMPLDSSELDRMLTALRCVNARLTPPAPTLSDAPLQIDFVVASEELARHTSQQLAQQSGANGVDKLKNGGNNLSSHAADDRDARVARGFDTNGMPAADSSNSSTYPHFRSRRVEELFGSDHYAIYTDIVLPE